MHSGGECRHTQPTIPTVLTAALVVASAILYYLNISPARFGFYHDDSLYVVTGKAMAAGDGYRIPSLPQSPPQTKYPPLYPLVLALVWRICPRFPQNLTPMLYVSVILALVLPLCAWGYLRNRRYASPWQCVVIIALLSFNFRELLLATSLLSELLYGVLSVAALWLGDAYIESRRRRTGLLLSLFIILALLTRISGIALLIAVILHLRRERIRKSGLVVVIPPILAFGLWLAWCYAAGSSSSSSPELSFYTSYSQDWMQMVSDYARQIGQPAITALALLALKNLFMSVVASTSVVVMGLSYQGLPTLWGFPVGLLSIVVCFSLLLFGFLSQRLSHPGIIHTYTITYLLLHIMWPYTAYDRFLMPILPFLLLYFVCAVGKAAKTATREVRLAFSPWRLAMTAPTATMLLLGSLFIGYNQLAGWTRKVAEDRADTARFTECDMPTFAWIRRNTKPSDTLVCYQDVKYFLFTDRRAVRTVYRVHAQQPGQSLEEMIRRVGASHLILTADDFALESRGAAVRRSMRSYVLAHPDRFETVLEEDRCRNAAFRIRGDK
jgi:hypothetical protein